MSSSRKLVIVESPAKAKTIGKYLGDNYEVLASVGHIRDLPKPSELPADMKKGPFGKFAVNVEDNFEPYYVVSENSKKTVAELKKAKMIVEVSTTNRFASAPTMPVAMLGSFLSKPPTLRGFS